MAYPLRAPFHKEDAWHTLVHVCQRWRRVVFGSPCRLYLKLLCVNRRLLNSLDIWPELPIVIYISDEARCQLTSVSDVISVLTGKRHDRVCKIFIDGVSDSLLEDLETTSGPFPALVELELVSFEEYPLILSDSFLGGSVPSLRSLFLLGIPFPGIRKLLLSTRDLVTLSLKFIPPSGFISPESMVAILSTLTRLESLHLHFQIPEFRTHEGSQRHPTLTRIVLPALTNLDFYGNAKYLEELVSRIDALLDCIAVTFSDQGAPDIPLLRDFIGRTKIPNAHRTNIYFSCSNAMISLFRRKGDVDFKVLKMKIHSSTYDLDLSSLVQACSSILPPLPTLEHLGIYNSIPFPSRWQYASEVKNTQLMELLRPFPTVKDLVLNDLAGLSVASALQELVEERVTGILPVLQNIFLKGSPSSGPVPKGIAKFIAARELSGRPVIVHQQETNQGR